MLLQLVVILSTSIIFLLINNTLSFGSILFGGLISIINNFLIIRINNKQKTIKPDNANIGFGILIYSVISRLIIVAALVFLSFKLELLAFEVIFGLIIGQVILIIDKLKNKPIN